MPLHPGAARFYREAGLLTDGGDAPPGKPAPDTKAPASTSHAPEARPASGGSTGSKPAD